MAERRSASWGERLPQTRPKEDAEGYRWHEDIMDRDNEDEELDREQSIRKDTTIVAKIRCVSSTAHVDSARVVCP